MYVFFFFFIAGTNVGCLAGRHETLSCGVSQPSGQPYEDGQADGAERRPPAAGCGAVTLTDEVLCN